VRKGRLEEAIPHNRPRLKHHRNDGGLQRRQSPQLLWWIEVGSDVNQERSSQIVTHVRGSGVAAFLDGVRQEGHGMKTAALYPDTLDGRSFVVRGRLWRNSDPSLDEDTRKHLVQA
jgi:hypothetical protein